MVKLQGTAARREFDVDHLSVAERAELTKLGAISENGVSLPYLPLRRMPRASIERNAVSAANVLNEAYDYARPSSFSRALSFDVGNAELLLISGTASVDEHGATMHIGDLRAQCWRTYRNITELLDSANMTWHDVVRTTCYLRDIERDYRDFNEVRTAFFRWLELDPLPASTGIQARLCREDLLIEIEAIAIARRGQGGRGGGGGGGGGGRER